MGFYERQVLPRLVDVALGSRAIGKLRQRAIAGLTGTVLELGFGSGTNMPFYPPSVQRVYAVDPALVARKLAAKRLAASPISVEFVGIDGAAVALDDASVDAAVSTWTLCTIPDVDQALREVRRVLRPGGHLVFLEHGLSDDPKVARRQHRFDALQQRFAGGCHLDRDHAALIAASGLEIEHLERFSIAGPKMLSSMYAGRAGK